MKAISYKDKDKVLAYTILEMVDHGKVDGLEIYKMDKVNILIKMEVYSLVFGKWAKI